MLIAIAVPSFYPLGCSSAMRQTCLPLLFLAHLKWWAQWKNRKQETYENVRRACGRVSKGVYLGRGTSGEGTFRRGQVNTLLKELLVPIIQQ